MPNGLKAAVAPTREVGASALFRDQPKGGKVQFNVKINGELATFAKVLAARRGVQTWEVVEEALRDLEAKHGAA